MRLMLPGIGLNIVLFGLAIPNLTAVAAPVAPTSLGDGAVSIVGISDRHQQIDRGNISQQSIAGTTIQGNGVEFIAPAEFQGGSPSSAQIQTMIGETAKMFPSLASIVQNLQRNPTFFRAIAMNTSTAEKNPSIVVVTQLPGSSKMTLEYLEATMAKLMPSMLPPEFKLVDSRVMQVGTRQIVRLSITGNIQGDKFKQSIGLLKEGDAIFQVTYVGASANSDRDRSIFEQMIRTFKTTDSMSDKIPTI